MRYPCTSRTLALAGEVFAKADGAPIWWAKWRTSSEGNSGRVTAMLKSTIARRPNLQSSLEEALIGANASQTAELRAAKDYFASDTSLPTDLAIRSFDRAADAIKDGIRVFISYKYRDRIVAAKLKDLIGDYGQSRLARDRDNKPYVFLGEQGMEVGKDYPKQIREEIEKCHWFFVLLPDIQSNREWRICEAG